MHMTSLSRPEYLHVVWQAKACTLQQELEYHQARRCFQGVKGSLKPALAHCRESVHQEHRLGAQATMIKLVCSEQGQVPTDP